MPLYSIARPMAARILPRDLYVALDPLWPELRSWRLHRSGCKRAKQFLGQRDLRLNVGCGPNVKPGWINIDRSGSPDVLPVDLRRNLPFSDSSSAILYGEHVFEYLEYPEEAMRFLSEAYRVLQPNGVLSLGVPDAELALKSYAARDRWVLERFPFLPEWCDTPMHRVNFLFRDDGHKYAYDFETLGRIVEKAGFSDVARREFDRNLDSEKRRIRTLYISAKKPSRPN
jgi:predicted SAM-dependent methyltransferase